MRARSSKALAILTFVLGAGGGEAATPQKEVSRLARLAGGTVGVGAIHLETGESIYHNPDQPFPMASTYKVPIALQLLRRVEEGEISLDEMRSLRPYDLHPGSGTISRLLDDPGVSLSLINLLELMMLISDNSATDLLLAEAGGHQAVNSNLADKGISGVRVDRPTVLLIANWVGIDEVPAREEWSPELFRNLFVEVSDEQRAKAAERFQSDPRDTATPRGMAALLARLWKGELLNSKHTDLLIDIMKRCETGERRIRGMLPPETVVGHKTGTIGGTTNDVGVIELPDGAGHVALAIFVKGSEKPVSQRERTIAHIARAVYDYFLFRGAGSAP